MKKEWIGIAGIAAAAAVLTAVTVCHPFGGILWRQYLRSKCCSSINIFL